MSKVIRSEQVDACQSWLAPDMQSKDQGPLTAGQMEDLQVQAQKEGFAQGLQEGRAAAAEQINAQAKQLNAMLHALQEPFSELDEVVEQQLVQLAMLVAKQLIRRELKTDPAQVIAVVREALAALPIASRQLQLFLHPDDVELVKNALSMGDEQPIKIVEDPVQTRGGCRVLTDKSQVDATVESRINAIIANVLGGERRTDGECSDDAES